MDDMNKASLIPKHIAERVYLYNTSIGIYFHGLELFHIIRTILADIAEYT